MRAFGIGCAVALAVSAWTATALDTPSPGPGWEEARRDDQFVIYVRDDPATSAREISATAEMNAPPKAIFDVVIDFANYPKFMPYTKEARVLYWVDPNVFVEYTRVSAPFVSDRDSVNQITLTRGTASNGGVYKSEWVTKPELTPEQDGVVRVRLNTGSWVIQPIDGGRRSRVTYYILTNPGGYVPQWVANQSNKQFIPELYKAVEQRAMGK